MSTLRTTKLPMNLRHCTQPLNTHQLTTAHAQHEAATDITRGIGIVAVVERRSESRVRAGLWQRRTSECDQLYKKKECQLHTQTASKNKPANIRTAIRSMTQMSRAHADVAVLRKNGTHLQMARVLAPDARCTHRPPTSKKCQGMFRTASRCLYGGRQSKVKTDKMW